MASEEVPHAACQSGKNVYFIIPGNKDLGITAVRYRVEKHGSIFKLAKKEGKDWSL
jgi:hypothetical protein